AVRRRTGVCLHRGEHVPIRRGRTGPAGAPAGPRPAGPARPPGRPPPFAGPAGRASGGPAFAWAGPAAALGRRDGRGVRAARQPDRGRVGRPHGRIPRTTGGRGPGRPPADAPRPHPGTLGADRGGRTVCLRLRATTSFPPGERGRG